MSPVPNESRLTAAAVEALEEYLNDMRAELLRRASDIADRAMAGRASEITVRDVVAAAEEASRGIHNDGRRRFRERLLRAYALVFASVVLTGAVLWIGPELASLSTQSRIGLLLAIIGAIGLVASRTALEWVKSADRPLARSDHRNVSDAEALVGMFLRRYADLELALRDFNARTLGEAGSVRTPTLAAIESGRLDVRTKEEVRRAVDVRNRLVHGKAVSEVEIREAIAAMQRAQDLIEVI